MGMAEFVELAKRISDKQEELSKIDAEIDKLDQQKKVISTEIDDLKDQLLAAVKASDEFVDNKFVKEFDDIHVEYFSKVSIGYTSDDAVLKYLKDNGYKSCINVKESLAKKALNAELKTNTALKEALDKMIVKSTTDWVVVTSLENAQKMHEHIEAGKEKTKLAE